MKFVDRYFSSNLLRIFSYTASPTIIKMLTGFVSIKIIALLVGPKGLVMLGQLNNFNTIALTIASGGLSFGVTKFTSEHKEDVVNLNSYLSVGFQITLLFSFLCGTGLLVFSNYLSSKILLDKQYAFVFIIFAFTIIFFATNNFFIAVLNGFKELKKYAFVGIANSIIGLIFTILLVWTYRLEGVLVSAVTFQSVAIIATVILLYRLPWFSRNVFFHKFSINQTSKGSIARKYFSYSLMAFVTAAVVPVALLIIRSNLIKVLSIKDAGIWEGMNRLSFMYLMVFSTSISIYYLPRLSEVVEKNLVYKEVVKYFRLIIPPLLLVFSGIYLFRQEIVIIIFSRTFLEMRDLFLWQLFGDFFKIATWLISFVFIAKSYTWYFILVELITYAIYCCVSLLLMPRYGLKGVMSAYCISYVFVFILSFFIFRKLYKQRSQ